jgi:Tfp pilus assembly protein PilX
MRRLHDQRGIAAVTVLMVTAVTALAGASVLFAATAELDIGARDRRAEDAFAAAEAGLDQAAAYLFAHPSAFSDIPAPGPKERCLNNSLVVDTPDISCEISVTSPTDGALPPPPADPVIQYDVVSTAREGASATRVLASRFRLVPKEVPYGLYVNGNLDLGGGPQLFQISLLVNGVVTSREKIQTDADGDGNPFNDPDLGWRFHEDKILSNPAPNTSCQSNTVGCVGVFSNFQIYEKTAKATNEIHGPLGDVPPTSSKFPNDRDTHQQVIIGGVAQNVVTLPETNVLEAMEGLKQVAKSQTTSAGRNFLSFKDGSNQTITIQPSTIGAPAKNFDKDVVFYIDADAGDIIKWRPSLIPDSLSSDIRYINPDGDKVGSHSGVIVVRGGQLQLEAGTQWFGALFAPENEVRLLGTNTCTCTIYGKGFEKQGGNATVQLIPEWFGKLPAGFFAVERQAFVECEPFQESAFCPSP